ncbi:MAG: hypothetical protein NTW86_12490, partial [Candidatus Sumerlaeota bacterium]|nr:hypothetical protein [Candidatus Sumerlaeota bacterium]
VGATWADVTPTGGGSWSLSASSVYFLDHGVTGVDVANGPFDADATVNFSGDTRLTQPSVSAPFSLLNPAGDFLPTYSEGQSLTLQFRYAPSANDGSVATQPAAINAAAGTPASRMVQLNGQTLTAATIAQFRAEAEGGTAGTTKYKLTGTVSSNSIQPPRNTLSIQDRADGNAATRGVIVDDALGTGKGAGALPDVGDTLVVCGSAANYHGLWQLAVDRPYEIGGGGAALAPVPLPNSLALTDTVEGVLVRLVNAAIAAGTYTAPVGIAANDGRDFTIRLQTGAAFSFTSAGGVYRVLGIGGQYDPAGNPLAGGGGYELLPRSESDFVQTTGVSHWQRY